MYAATSRSDAPALLPAYIRASGRIACRLGVAPDGSTRLLDLGEGGGYRLKFPRGPRFEGVVVNTGGGMAGGDRVDVTVEAGDGTTAVLTTQSAEKIYRAQRDAAHVATTLRLGSDARLAWIPQPTLLFDGARLERRLDAELPASGRLLVAETVVLGRIAMGEEVSAGSLSDRWRIRRDGRLLFAEALRLDNPIDRLLSGRCTGGGGRALASILLVGPDAEAALEPVRSVDPPVGCESGASAWNGMLSVRVIGADPAAVTRHVGSVLQHLGEAALPRVWS
jgi:urease accessory protein